VKFCIDFNQFLCFDFRNVALQEVLAIQGLGTPDVGCQTIYKVNTNDLSGFKYLLTKTKWYTEVKLTTRLQEPLLNVVTLSGAQLEHAQHFLWL
jgi:hypothetical protein